ncbi:LamG-like jellyroll fold domain-containing protein [Dokdonia pacifica]|uniref:Por secretion system C-terminal sorting domain-containing protein n=1 Tax=Dokdonia pacifica TaxID=1627892 RepID=A0A238W6G9_9FLAO|nr:LamG-like jellyroll fold domain-containing protein [Dokdonia pacifica]SNR42136.1 Por secretion system C-terminal sorting domain-containing protein [Dokdonia pacifica]
MNKLILLFLFIFTSFSVYGQDINEDLLLHYTFNNTYLDATENGYDATDFGTSFTEDRFGNTDGALLFDGVNDYINLPNIEALKPDLPVSFSFWIRYDSEDPDDRDVFNTSFEEDINTGIYFNSQQSTGNFAVNYGDGSSNYTSTTRRTYVSNEPINTGTWQHIAIVVSSQNDMKIYVDCKEYEGEYSGTGGDLQYSNTSGTIGRHDRQLEVPANYFKGAIDNFRYWNKALTEDEVTLLCEEVLDIEEVPLVIKETTMYPNPTDGIVHFDTKNNTYDTVILFNNIGQTVLRTAYQNTLDFSRLPKGIYYIHFIKNNIQLEIKKVIIK